MQENHSIARGDEMLGGGCPASSGAEVVDETDGLALEGDGGAAGGDEDNATVEGGVVGDEGLGEGDVGLEVFGGRVGGEVGVFFGCGHGCCFYRLPSIGE